MKIAVLLCALLVSACSAEINTRSRSLLELNSTQRLKDSDSFVIPLTYNDEAFSTVYTTPAYFGSNR